MSSSPSVRLGRLLLLAAVLAASTAPAAALDFDTGNAPLEVVIPTVAPVIFGFVSPTANDATLVLRTTTLVTNAWFDATAPYHPTAVGIYSDLGRRPASESLTNANMNVALLYASKHVLDSLYPGQQSLWSQMLSDVGLDPDDAQESTTTAIGIGNLAGKAIVAAREHDGMNQLGDAGGRKYNLEPYRDYTGYAPVNTAHVLKNPSRWQPAIVTAGNGLFKIQKAVTPQLRLTTPYSYAQPNPFHAPPPLKSNPKGPDGKEGYKEQADQVLAVSAALTDHQKAVAEFFDNKIFSLGFSAIFAAQSRGLDLLGFIQLDFLTNMAAFDTAIAVWGEKFHWDAVRPFSAIRHLYGNQEITAWGGPGQGTVTDITGREWKSYLNTADHPEYPSASASFCAAHAQAARLLLGDDLLGFSVPVPAGSSLVEPGVTPASDLVLEWATWTEFSEECGISRLWGGVHFFDSIPAGQAIGHQIGTIAHEFVQAHIDGSAP